MKKILFLLGAIISSSLFSGVVFAQEYPITQSYIDNYVQSTNSSIRDAFTKCIGRSPTKSESDAYFSSVVNGGSLSNVLSDICKRSDSLQSQVKTPTQATQAVKDALKDSNVFILGKSTSTKVQVLVNDVNTKVSSSSINKGPSCGDLSSNRGYSEGSCGKNPGGYINIGDTYDCHPCYGGGATSKPADIVSSVNNDVKNELPVLNHESLFQKVVSTVTSTISNVAHAVIVAPVKAIGGLIGKLFSGLHK